MSEQPLALQLLAEDRSLVNYRPNFARLTGSVTAAVLLQQIFFRWTHHGREPFFKFKEPCSHDEYREGDSWCEELAFTKHEFDGALKKVGTKVTRGKNKTALMDYEWPDFPEDKESDEYDKAWSKAIKHIVIYWTDSNRMTWYHFNEAVFQAALSAVYLGKSTFRTYLGKTEKRTYLEKPESGDTSSTNTTPETTPEKKDSADTAKPVSTQPQADEPTDVKPERDLIFEAVITRGFNVSLDDRAAVAAVRDKANWITSWCKGNPVKMHSRDKTKSLPGCNPPLMPEGINRFYDWFEEHHAGIQITTAPMYAKYIGQARKQLSGSNGHLKPDNVAPNPNPDCAVCSGLGYVIDANTDAQAACPACIAEVEYA